MAVLPFVGAGRVGRLWNRLYRRAFSTAPTSRTPQDDAMWQERLFRYYATNQPYAHPLTITHGNLTGETWEMRQGYREWSLKEPTVKAALFTKCLAVCQLNAVITPADKNSPVDREAADWVKYALSASDEGIGGIIFNMLVPALMDGFSVVEKVFDKVEAQAGKYAGFWTLKSAASIDTQFMRFRLDTYRQVIGVQSMAGSQGGVEMNPKDYMIFTHCKLFENPFGVSDLRAVVRACKLIESAIRLRHILMTNYSGPLIKATAGDPAAKAKLLNIMQNARANGWIVVPEGTEVEVLNLASAASTTEFKEGIEFHQRDIVTGIQGSYLQLLEGGVADGRGNTEVHKGVAQLYQWWLAAWVCQVINKQLIPDLVIPNFGMRAGMPRITLGGIDNGAIKTALDRFQQLHALGIVLSQDQVRDEGRAEMWRDEADKLPPPTPPQQGGQQPGGPPKPGGGDDGDDPFGGMFAHVGGEGGASGSSGTFRGGEESAFRDLLAGDRAFGVLDA